MDYEVSLCCPPGPENGTVLKLQCSADDWHLDYKDLPFTSSIEIACTDNSTWLMLSEIKTPDGLPTTDFCKDGSLQCSHPTLPNCQDRTVLCMESSRKIKKLSRKFYKYFYFFRKKKLIYGHRFQND